MRGKATLAAALTTSALAAPALAHADATTGGTSAPDGGGAASAQTAPSPTPSTPGQPTVAGTRAKLIRGIAYAPASAPSRVKKAIWATNKIVHRPYKLGGGHGRWNDTGYDCSGLVSYFLNAAGLLKAPMSAPGFIPWGQAGRGRWITIYARSGHVYAVVAGLRLDTTPWPSRGTEGSDWRPQLRDASAFTPRHPAGL
ncbi:MAG: hypothetical protein QOK04_318 [Solirubrobacteraceae bacterium]|nr:hypothetical protein [Solirubrobacteraceae bacterium]